MPMHVDKNAAVDPRAELADDVEVGPFCVVGPNVRIGRGTILTNCVTIMGRVTIGEGNRFFPGAVIGGETKDISYRGCETEVVIGDDRVLRQAVSIYGRIEHEDGLTP